MLMILVPISTTLLCFLACAACLRFILSRQGWFWVLPLFISVSFLYISIDPLMKVATGLISGPYMVEISPDRSVREIIPLIIVFIWYSMIITFRYALKMVVPVNRHLLNTEKNLKESRYMEKVELRRRKKTMRKKARRSDVMSRMQQGKIYTQDWVKLFDDK
jgi:hypothetical protein